MTHFLKHSRYVAILLSLIATAACTTSNTQPRSDATKQVGQFTSPNATRARNVILFIGDGMSLDTITAARILAGQQLGQPGEEHLLSFEKLPNVGLSKTYNTNQQVPDSAGTATAMLSGVKTLAGVIGVGPTTVRGNCKTAQAARLDTLTEMAEQAGLSTGVVTTARITHATPAATYAHGPERSWEHDAAIPEDQRGCTDIARQLIEFKHGDGLDIVLGGGSAVFVGAEKGGARTDQRDLFDAWTQRGSETHEVVQTATALSTAMHNNMNGQPSKILGVFSPSHMSFESVRPNHEPSLTVMTTAAVQYLQHRDSGYFLMVEAGRIDHAHHSGTAGNALLETIEFANAIEATLKRVSLDDTLVIVTADHGHTMTIGGYPTRGNPILGRVIENGPDGSSTNTPALDANGVPYTTLAYANGPGATEERNLHTDEVEAPDYKQAAATPLTYGETHSATDVPIYAAGPGAHNVRGVMEQNLIFNVMRDALGL